VIEKIQLNNTTGVCAMWGSEAEKKQFAVLFPLFYGSQAERDYAKGIKIIKKLAANGYVPAICELGLAYFDHLGVRRNYKESFRYYGESALKGYPSAEGAIGNFYAIVKPEHGACVHSPEKAAQWWLRAAEHGNAGAQCNLANASLTGLGVEKDPVEAYIWATLAVHCSVIRFRSAEVFRDQAAALITEQEKEKADMRIETLKMKLPLEWSEHMVYWKKLAEEKQ
jgi:hypothetical protein